jgi:hypothetical protein
MSTRSGRPRGAAAKGSDRGKRATFDRQTGQVSGSGSGAGNGGVGDEDYDDDLSAGSGGGRKGGEPGNAA